MEREWECRTDSVRCLLRNLRDESGSKLGKEEEDPFSVRVVPFCCCEQEKGNELGEDAESIAVLTERIFVCSSV